MKRKAIPFSEIPLRTLAEGHCKSLQNAERLIEDGRILLQNGRDVGAINSFRLAVEEISKAHLLNQPVSYQSKDSDKWKWFWKAFRSHKEKLRIIEYEFSWKTIRNLEEFDKRIELLISTREDSIYVKFDSEIEKFLLPEETLGLAGGLKDTAELELKYASALFGIFTLAGMPTVDQIARVYQMQRDTET